MLIMFKQAIVAVTTYQLDCPGDECCVMRSIENMILDKIFSSLPNMHWYWKERNVVDQKGLGNCDLKCSYCVGKEQFYTHKSSAYEKFHGTEQFISSCRGEGMLFFVMHVNFILMNKWTWIAACLLPRLLCWNPKLHNIRKTFFCEWYKDHDLRALCNKVLWIKNKCDLPTTPDNHFELS